MNARADRTLTLGVDAAASLGVDSNRLRLVVVVGVALGVGAAVAVAGSIGFVGLIAPHLVRTCGGFRSGARAVAGCACRRGAAHGRRHCGARDPCRR